MPSAALMRARLSSLERQMMDFAKDHHFMNLYSRLEAKAKEATAFRNQNYPYFKEELDDVLAALMKRVDSNSHELGRQLVVIGNDLSAELRQASFFVNIANNDEVEESLLETAGREIQDFERKFRQSKELYFSLIDPNFEEKMQAIDKLLKRIPYYMQMREEASFEFASNEKVVMADKAEWVVSGKGKEDPDGIFFLTNQRICFEQKETTGKFLGLFGGEKQHGLQWEYPLGQIESLSHKDEGMLKGKDMLTIGMKPGAKHSSISLEVKGEDDNEVWCRVIEQMRQTVRPALPESGEVEIQHRIGVDEGYYDGEYIYIGKETPYRVELGRNCWEVMEGEQVIRTIEGRDVKPGSLLTAELGRLLAEYQEAGWKLVEAVESTPVAVRAETFTSRYVLKKS